MARVACPTASFVRFPVAVLMAMALVQAAVAISAAISGVITLDANRAQTVWPNARVTLKTFGMNAEVSTVSSDLGCGGSTVILTSSGQLNHA